MDKAVNKTNLMAAEITLHGVKEYLASLGIDPKRMTAKGFGETQPKVENTSEINKAKNRRTEFLIQGM